MIHVITYQQLLSLVHSIVWSWQGLIMFTIWVHKKYNFHDDTTGLLYRKNYHKHQMLARKKNKYKSCALQNWVFTFYTYLWLKYDQEKVLCTSRLTRPGFETMTSRSRTVHFMSLRRVVLTSRPSVTSNQEMLLLQFLRGVRWFQMHGISDRLMHWQLIFLVQVRLT